MAVPEKYFTPELVLSFQGASLSTVICGGAPPRGAVHFGGPLIPTTDGLRNSSTRLRLTPGSHAFELKVGAGGFGTGPYRPTGPMQLRLAWVTPGHRQAMIDEAVEAARGARAAVVFAYNEGTEGRDRTSLALPDGQDALIEAVAETSAGRTIVVLNTGDPVLMPWVVKVDAVLQLWYPGQEGGGAPAALLLGEANPGRKLPVTFPRCEADLPTTKPEQYPGVETANGLGQWYSEGTFVGYRWYDQQGIEPLFPFGHGLSYTRFEYSDLTVQPRSDGFEVSFQVRNAGGVTGAEVPQALLFQTQAGPRESSLSVLTDGDAATARLGETELTGTWKEGVLLLEGEHYAAEPGYSDKLKLEGRLVGGDLRGESSWGEYVSTFVGKRAER